MNSTATKNAPAANQKYPRSPASEYQTEGRLQPVDDLLEYAMTYARQNPGTAALWCFGLGFIVGWKLKPW